MSEPKLITPLLANHIMGEPISEHHGVRCCPAMLKDSDNKYIVKIISIPASSVQLDALLLTGAYKSKEDALLYFKELADQTVEEARILEKLSKLEGFHAYPSWQVEPMEDGTGYDVYLLGEYNMTLERYLRRNCLTHLKAVNLGLDLCAALSVCRRSGYLYVDLKPENIFMTPGNEYKIGDLGFIRLSSLKYASLPDKYRNAYTAPEITDAFSSLNTTVDIYALGLILYQLYNDGKLPEKGELVPPIYADYEMAEIILKACAENPEDRWQDPQQMGQALVSYMQRNTVNDVPIIPLPEPEPEPETVIEEEPESVEEEQTPEEVTEEAEEIADVVENSEDEDASLEEVEVSPDIQSDSESEVEENAEEDDLEQFMIDGFETDETAPDESNSEGLAAVTLSAEVDEMLAQADELIAHEAPAPVVAPEPVEIPMPEPIVLEEEQPEAETEEPQEEQAEEEPETETTDETEESAVVEQAPVPKPKRKLKGLISLLVAVLITLLIAAGIFYYYENYYLQHIYDIDIHAEEDHMTVILDTPIDNSLLTVYLQDTYGNRRHESVSGNQAAFTGLNSGTTYDIYVEIDGYHKLIGNTHTKYTTATQTNIVSFTAIAGDSDGSVILNFSVQGPDNTNWFVKYSADGIAEQTALCTGHMATITGLEVGSTYTFRLVPEADLYVVGNETLEYTAQPVIYAQDLAIQGFDAGKLLVSWSAPEGITVNSWTVRCYNSEGFDTTITVTEPTAAIEVPDVSLGYTVDVKAEGMSVSKWTSVTAGSLTFKGITFDDSTSGELNISWEFEGNAPTDGWRLMYTVDGSEKFIIQSDTNSCTISPVVPGGKYSFSFVLPDDVTVFGGTAEHTVAKAKSFDAYGVQAEDFSFDMCPTPDEVGWIWYDIWTGYYTDTFTSGEKASLIIYMDSKFEKSNDEIPTLFILRNADGIPISIAEGRCRTWKSMWIQYHTELDLPVTPTTPGKYTLELYFADQYVGTVSFTITPQEAEE